MDFRLTAAQLELQEHVSDYCARTFTRERLAAMDGRGIDRAGWTALADLGLFALRIPESEGGLGLGWVESAVAYEVLGSHLVPGPLVWTQLLAGVLEGVADGSRIVTGVDAGHEDEPFLVEHLGLADAFAWVADDGVRMVDRAHFPPHEALTPLDPLTPVWQIAGPALLMEGAVRGTTDVARLGVEGAALTAALLVGIADRALMVARDHALAREQFDRPIAAFQAIQHLLADMYVRVMLARSAAYAAAAVLDDPAAGDPAVAAASAKVVAGDAAMANARTCIQVHGGMGFTWEMIPHYLLKRTWVLEQTFGTGPEHAEALAATWGA